MLRRLLNAWKNRFTAPGIAPERWSELCAGLPLLRRFERRELAVLHQLAGAFLQQKHLVGAAGLTVDDDMRALIAAQACVPVLALGLSWYDDWRTVILYPRGFVASHEYRDEAGVVHREARPLEGEATYAGPVVLSWEDTVDTLHDWESNLVLHEFAHKLDMRNGVANGMPPLHRGMDRDAWTHAFQSAYDDFCRRVDQGLELPFDDYADTDPAEFFAVASEAFFLTPDRVRTWYPAVYGQLGRFYRQWPADTARAGAGPAA